MIVNIVPFDSKHPTFGPYYGVVKITSITGPMNNDLKLLFANGKIEVVEIHPGRIYSLQIEEVQ